MCKFGGDQAICLREEAICAKVYRRTDRRTDDGRRAIALAHSWNELMTLNLAQRSFKVIHFGGNGKSTYGFI